MQEDLFADSVRLSAEGLPEAEWNYQRGWLDGVQATALLHLLQAQLAWEQSTIRVYGRWCKIPRLNAWYADPGCDYAYSGLRMPVNPWTPALQNLRERLQQATGHQFNSVLANLYRDGSDSVGWHADNEPELGRNPVIASLSLGAARVFQLKHCTRADVPRQSIELGHGDLLLMSGVTQHHWHHAIPKTRKPCGIRINLTFRRVLQQEHITSS